jgi:hypothetical protein
MNNRMKKTHKQIEDGVVSGYKAIENGVISGYKLIENGVVSGYKIVEDKVVDNLFKKEGETTEEAKNRLNSMAEKDKQQ